MIGADAQRLRDDPALRDVLDAIRARALQSAIYDPDPSSRNEGRQLVVAIDFLRGELQTRIDTVLEIERRQTLDRAYE